MMAPRQLLLIVLAFLAISEISTSSSSSNSNRWRRCRNLPSPSKGQVTRNGLNTIDYECNPGYKLAVTATCQRGKSWTPSVTCEEILCEGEPVIAANSLLDGDITSRQPGAEYNFTCDPGLKGMGKVVCDESGKWNVDEVQCTEILCNGEPVIAANSLLDGDITSRQPGAEYNFTCDPGFKGMGKVVCDESGKWNVDEVECTEILCNSEPVIAANSSLDGDITSRQPGAEYNFTCDPGFRDGMGKVVCDESGKWNVDDVQCTECIALNETSIRFDADASIKEEPADCNAVCANDPTCITRFDKTVCFRYFLPIIGVSFLPTLDDCIAACNENDECKVLSYNPTGGFCYLTNTNDIDDLRTYRPTLLPGCTTLEINCPSANK